MIASPEARSPPSRPSRSPRPGSELRRVKSPDENCALNARALALPGASASASHASAALSAALSRAIGARRRSRRSAVASADTSIDADIGKAQRKRERGQRRRSGRTARDDGRLAHLVARRERAQLSEDRDEEAA